MTTAAMTTKEKVKGGGGEAKKTWLAATPLRPSKIIGIGRNYKSHCVELNNQLPRKPILFFKPPSSLIPSSSCSLSIAPFTPAMDSSGGSANQTAVQSGDGETTKALLSRTATSQTLPPLFPLDEGHQQQQQKQISSPSSSRAMLEIVAEKKLQKEGVLGSTAIENEKYDDNIHHEVELVLVIGRRLKNASREEAMGAICGVTVGLDLTDRTAQMEEKENALPWVVSKGRDGFAAICCGTIPLHSGFAASPEEGRRRVASPADMKDNEDANDVLMDISNWEMELKLNGESRQLGSVREMLFPAADILSYTSSIMTLEKGDLIYTGTPDGIGPVRKGDVLQCHLRLPLQKGGSGEDQNSDDGSASSSSSSALHLTTEFEVGALPPIPSFVVQYD